MEKATIKHIIYNGLLEKSEAVSLLRISTNSSYKHHCQYAEIVSLITKSIALKRWMKNV